jgi:hypothetical protein
MRTYADVCCSTNSCYLGDAYRCESCPYKVTHPSVFFCGSGAHLLSLTYICTHTHTHTHTHWRASLVSRLFVLSVTVCTRGSLVSSAPTFTNIALERERESVGCNWGGYSVALSASEADAVRELDAVLACWFVSVFIACVMTFGARVRVCLCLCVFVCVCGVCNDQGLPPFKPGEKVALASVCDL